LALYFINYQTTRAILTQSQKSCACRQHVDAIRLDSFPPHAVSDGQ
jgi:hypothetical protein